MTAAELSQPGTLQFSAALAALVFGALGMGASPIFVRLADVGPFASAFWRVALAVPVLWAWLQIAQRGQKTAAPGGWSAPVVLAGLFFAGDLFFWHLSILHTTVANATFFATTAPVWVVLALAFGAGAKVRRAEAAGLILCLAGGSLLLGESLGLAPGRVVGDLFGLVTALFFAAYVLAVDRARTSVSTAELMLRSTLVTAAVLLVVALALEDHVLPRTPFGLTMLAALALVSQVGGQGLFAYAIGHLPTIFSALVVFLETVAAAGLGWLILAEPLSGLQFAGGLAIAAGLWVARPKHAPNHAPSRP